MSKKAKNIFVFISVLGIAGLLTSTGYFYYQYQQVVNNPETISQKEIESVIKGIERSIDLPDDETPTFATIMDKSQIQDQPFFREAENGDKVLVYPESRKAILYRPSSNKIIEFAPLVLGVSTETDEEKLAVFDVAIYNSTDNEKSMSLAKEKIVDIDGLNIVYTDDSVNEYSQTQVIDLTENNSDIAILLGQFLEGEVAQDIPDGEIKPDADILIIIGSENSNFDDAEENAP